MEPDERKMFSKSKYLTPMIMGDGAKDVLQVVPQKVDTFDSDRQTTDLSKLSGGAIILKRTVNLERNHFRLLSDPWLLSPVNQRLAVQCVSWLPFCHYCRWSKLKLGYIIAIYHGQSSRIPTENTHTFVV